MIEPTITVLCGNNRVILKECPDNYADSVVTDGPYELGFMGKSWDKTGIVNDPQFWKEVLRVMKPGAFLLSFGGTRTYHRMACAIEDAGFEIRDQMQWIYGSGFPKSLNVSKAIDEYLGAERKVIGRRMHPTLKDTSKLTESKSGVHALHDTWEREWDLTAPGTPEAEQWDGWGTALKPAHEPICVARKPLIGTVVDNVLTHGTGGINIEGCRIALEGEKPPSGSAKRVFAKNGFNTGEKYGDNTVTPAAGRFPSNIIFDEEAAKELDRQTGTLTSGKPIGTTSGNQGNAYGKYNPTPLTGFGDSGGASRFFYCAKASRSERNKGLEKFPEKILKWSSGEKNPGTFQAEGTNRMSNNFHPTVKPVSLMRYLVRLVTQRGGVCLDPFGGSGTTGIACKLEGINAVLIEQEEEYAKMSRARIEAWEEEKQDSQLDLFNYREK